MRRSLHTLLEEDCTYQNPLTGFTLRRLLTLNHKSMALLCQMINNDVKTPLLKAKTRITEWQLLP